jgi:hypothetical protein
VFLVSSEKEFKDRHRKDLSRSRFINTMQSESKAKLCSPDETVDRLKKEHYAGSPKNSSF